MEQLAVEIIPGGGGDTGASAAAGVMVAAAGNEADVMAAGTVQVTADVAAIDLKKRKVTLQLPDGSTQKVKVDKSINLSSVHVGDGVTVEVTEAIAIDYKAM
jgi:hypothetical protein